MFQVGLSVEIFRFYEAYSFFSSTLHNEHICWKEFILIDSDEVSDLYLTPAHILEPARPPAEPLACRIVLLRVLFVPTVVLIRILAHRGEHDKDEWWKHGRFSI